jgi:hypothetical protein
MTIETPSESIEALAAEWLARERRATTERNETAAQHAVEASERFERAIREGTQEDIRLAWEAARIIQGACEMGSPEWAEARQVSELLRVEYLAAADRGGGS